MLYIYFALIIIISVIYFIIILFFAIGWDKIKTYKKGFHSPSDVFISLIVPFRNEEKNILRLIHSILKQSLNREQFELILVNDHSTDNSKEIALDTLLGQMNTSCIDLLESTGKKNAILLGINHSKGNLIVTTDADCTHHTEWLQTIYSLYLEKKPKMIIGPVIMEGRNTFENYQCLDFLSLIASGAGASGINKPIMCNGANLAYEKEIFLSFSDPMNQKFKSGDDIFLLHQIKQKNANQIVFLKSQKAFVYAKAQKSFREFLYQRIRWSSKSKAYCDKDTITTAIIVFLENLTLMINLILSAFHIVFIYAFAYQLVAKSLVDFVLINKASVFFKKEKLKWHFIPVQLINILLIPFIAISGFLIKIRWKEIEQK